MAWIQAAAVLMREQMLVWTQHKKELDTSEHVRYL